MEEWLLHEPDGDQSIPVVGGRYELGPVIGRGAMADVFAGRDVRLERPVAIKLLRPELAHDPVVQSRFESEARLAARLVHPHVVAVFDTGEEHDRPYLIMERLSGRTLRDDLTAGPLPATAVAELAAQLLAALDAAHRMSIIHRDIKPGNILVGPESTWKVGDFGIAKALEFGGTDHTATGLVIGTPGYLAPERLFGGDASVQSDLYALAVVLYEALAGHRPFQANGVADSAKESASAIAGTGAVPLRDLRPEVEPSLAYAIERGLAAEPGARFASAAEMAKAIAGSSPLLAAAPTVPIPTRPGSTEVLPAASRPTLDQPPRRDVAARRRTIGLLAAAAILVIVVVVLATSGGGHGGARGAPSTTPATSPPASGSLPPGLNTALNNLDHQVQR